MNIIEYSILRNFPLSNPNRGFDGCPKKAPFGGVMRAYLSTWSQNFVHRQKLRENDVLSENFGYRTRQIGNLVAEQLKPDYDNFRKVIANKLVSLFSGKESKEDGQSNQLIHFSMKKVENIANILNEIDDISQVIDWADPSSYVKEIVQDSFDKNEDFKNLSEDVKKKILTNFYDWCDYGFEESGIKVDLSNPDKKTIESMIDFLSRMKKIVSPKSKPKSKVKTNHKELESSIINCAEGECVDISLFGRMSSQNIFGEVSGALGTAFAMGVNEYQEMIDDFVTNDDVATNAGYLGHKDTGHKLHSTMFYHYHWLDMQQLRANMPFLYEEDDMKNTVVAAVTDTLCTNVPMALNRKMGHRSLPIGILVVVREGQNINLANAFDRVVSPERGGLGRPSVSRLGNYFSKVRQEMGNHKAFWYSPQYDLRCKNGKTWEEIKDVERVQSIAELTEKLKQIV